MTIFFVNTTFFFSRKNHKAAKKDENQKGKLCGKIE